MTNYSPKDIIHGRARVCWGIDGLWHLPGGGRTMSRDVAETVCKAMNELMD